LVKRSTDYTGVSLEEEGWWRTRIRRVRDEVLRLLGKVGGGARLLEEELLVGQKKHPEKLKKLLGLSQDGVPGASGVEAPQIVGIVGVKGMGGVGKTTIALRLHDDPTVREWFTGGVLWLEVG
jgi:hypothetical protein